MRLRDGGISGSMLASKGMGARARQWRKRAISNGLSLFALGGSRAKIRSPGIPVEHSAPPGRGEGACVGEWRQTATIGTFNLLKFLKGLPLAATPKG